MSDEERRVLINLLQSDENISIKVAANQLGIKYENAKAILRVYRKENRLNQLVNHPDFRHKNKRASALGAPALTLQDFLEQQQVRKNKEPEVANGLKSKSMQPKEGRAVLNSFDHLNYLLESEAKVCFPERQLHSELRSTEAKVLISLIEDHFNFRSEIGSMVKDRDHKKLHRFFYCSTKDVYSEPKV